MHAAPPRPPAPPLPRSVPPGSDPANQADTAHLAHLPQPPDPAPRSAPAHAEWRALPQGRLVLRLTGDWRGHDQPLPAPPAAVSPTVAHPADPAHPSPLAVDASGLTDWDTPLASRLWQLLSPLVQQGHRPELGQLPPGLRAVLQLALPTAASAPSPAPTPSPSGAPADAPVRGPARAPAPVPAPPPAPATKSPGPVTRVGDRVNLALGRTGTTLGFVGEVLLALWRLTHRRTDLRASDLAWQLDQCGPRSLPIVSLVSFLVGLIVAYMGAAQLQTFGAQSFVADLVTVGVVREIAALMTAIVLSGRIGAAYAAQLGSMRANEEVDALRTLGVDPVEHLVLPRVLALAIAAPLLTAYAAVVGMAVGFVVAVSIFDVTPLDYLSRSAQALTLPHVGVGLLKGTVYAVLVGLAGCRQGLAAGASAQGVGQAVTQAVVQAIVWVVVAASVLTVVFQRLDI